MTHPPLLDASTHVPPALLPAALRRLAIVAVVAVTVAVTAACSGGGSSSGSAAGGGSSSSPDSDMTPRERRFAEPSRRFGERIADDDWTGAYGMLSASARQLMTLEQFTAYHLAECTEYYQDGPPLRVFGDLNTVDPEDLDRDEYEIPVSVPDSPRWEAWTYATFVLEEEPDQDTGEPIVDRCFSIGLLWVVEGGELKVAYFEYLWCD